MLQTPRLHHDCAVHDSPMSACCTAPPTSEHLLHPHVSADAIMLCLGRLLSQDDRNFHGWSYRRWVAARAELGPEHEEQYARECIHANFSNYSAWHARSQLLPQLSENQPPVSLQDLMAKPAGGDPACIFQFCFGWRSESGHADLFLYCPLLPLHCFVSQCKELCVILQRLRQAASSSASTMQVCVCCSG